MFDLALRARLPMVVVSTPDPTYAGSCLKTLLGFTDLVPKFDSYTPKLEPGAVRWTLGDIMIPSNPSSGQLPSGIYRWFKANGATLILVNPENPPALAYDAGVLPVPESLILSALHEVLDEAGAAEALPALGGLTVSQVQWAIALAGAKHGVLTREALADVRRTAFPVQRGLEPVSTTLRGYFPHPRLESWLKERGPFLLDSPDNRLKPRGLLFDGPPGTGKTWGAKRVAASLGLPLYRLSLEQVKGKYVGESEKALAQALAQADAASPCVIIMDEVEKLFTNQSDAGVSSNLLAGLLWWLQEHSSPVLTVMTTNDLEAIPKELWRPGRVDECLFFPGVEWAHAPQVVDCIAASYEGVWNLSRQSRKNVITLLWPGDHHAWIPHAEIEEAIKNEVREHLLRPAKGRVRMMK